MKHNQKHFLIPNSMTGEGKRSKIVVLHGSPKGEVSVTMQYVRYLKQHFTQHEFVTFPVAQRIRILEQNPDLFEEIIDQVRAADGVIWSFPLYVMTVCSQYQRFIELIHERYSGRRL